MAVNAHSLLQLPPEIVSLSHKCMLYRERVFQVYTLNPCFWPIRPRPLPVSHLPTILAQFCEDFTKFFSSGLWWQTHAHTHAHAHAHTHAHTHTHTHTCTHTHNTCMHTHTHTHTHIHTQLMSVACKITRDLVVSSSRSMAGQWCCTMESS